MRYDVQPCCESLNSRGKSFGDVTVDCVMNAMVWFLCIPFLCLEFGFLLDKIIKIDTKNTTGFFLASILDGIHFDNG
jgi:hypothetical protein